MGPTSIGRDETLAEPSVPTLLNPSMPDPSMPDPSMPDPSMPDPTVKSTAQSLIPARPAGRPSASAATRSTPTSEASDEGATAAPDSPTETNDKPAPASSRPKFRPPRTRARRPEAPPFNRLHLDERTAEADGERAADIAVAHGESELDPDGTELHADDPSEQGTRPDRRKDKRGKRAQRSGLAGLSGVAGWKIATAVLAAMAVLAVGWGVYQTTKVNRTQSALRLSGASTAAQIQGLEARMAALESQTASELAGLQQQLTDFSDAAAADADSAKKQYEKVQQSLSITAADYESAVSQTATLSAAYLTAKATADAAPADQAARIKSLEAKSLLLANCAKVWAGATQQIFTADNPQQAMAKVGKDLAGSASGCKVVTQ